MSDDVLITPASRKIEFFDSGGNVDGTIQLDSSGNLVLTSSVGLLIGDLDADIHIGDGSNTVDMVFDFAGSIYSAANQDLTIGKKSLGGNNVKIDTPTMMRITSDYGYVDIGPNNASWSHFYTDMPKYYFNKGVIVDTGIIGSYNEDLQLVTDQNETRVTIKATDGNVGIGTTDPEYKLDVQGGSVRILPTISSNAGTAIRIGAGGNSNDITLLRIDGESSNNSGESDSGQYGFSMKYMGSGTGNGNRFALFMDNQNGTAVEGLSVLQDGKVGIGTSSPASLLQVGSTAYEVENGIYLTSNNQRAVQQVIHADDANTNWYAQDIGLALHNTDNTDNNWSPHIVFSTHEDDDDDPTNANPVAVAAISATYNTRVANGRAKGTLVFFTNNAGTGNAERMRITSAGNVGIGTSSPAYLLDVAGSGRFTGNLRVENTLPELILIDTDATNDPTVRIMNNAGALSLRADSENVGTGGRIEFTTSGTERMRLTDAGNLGIGTTAPDAPLHVEHSSGLIAKFGEGNVETRMQFADARAMIGYQGDNAIIQGGSGGKGVSINVNNGTFGSGVALRVTSDGDVGIGTTSPGYKLDVNGSIRAQDDMYTDKLIASEGIRSSSRASFNTMQMYFFDRQSMGTQAVLLRAPVGGSSTANPSNYYMPHSGVVMQVLMGFYAQTLATSGTDTWTIIKTDTNGIASSLDYDVNFANLNRVGTTNSYNILIDLSVLADASNVDFVAGDMLQIQRTDSSPISIGNCNAQLWVTFDI